MLLGQRHQTLDRALCDRADFALVHPDHLGQHRVGGHGSCLLASTSDRPGDSTPVVHGSTGRLTGRYFPNRWNAIAERAGNGAPLAGSSDGTLNTRHNLVVRVTLGVEVEQVAVVSVGWSVIVIGKLSSEHSEGVIHR